MPVFNFILIICSLNNRLVFSNKSEMSLLVGDSMCTEFKPGNNAFTKILTYIFTIPLFYPLMLFR